MERVYRGVNYQQFYIQHGKFYDFIKARLKGKGVNLDDPAQYERVLNAAGTARGEAIRLILHELEILFRPGKLIPGIDLI